MDLCGLLELLIFLLLFFLVGVMRGDKGTSMNAGVGGGVSVGGVGGIDGGIVFDVDGFGGDFNIVVDVGIDGCGDVSVDFAIDFNIGDGFDVDNFNFPVDLNVGNGVDVNVGIGVDVNVDDEGVDAGVNESLASVVEVFVVAPQDLGNLDIGDNSTLTSLSDKDSWLLCLVRGLSMACFESGGPFVETTFSEDGVLLEAFVFPPPSSSLTFSAGFGILASLEFTDCLSKKKSLFFMLPLLNLKTVGLGKTNLGNVTS